MTKKLLAIVMALALVLSFAACGKKAEEAASTDAAETTEDAFANFGNETEITEAETEATEATEPETDANGETVATEATEAETTEEETTEEAAAKPQTKAEIIEYFNTAVNGVKTDAKSVTRNYSKISLNGSTTLPSSLDNILKLLGGADKFLGDQLSKNSKGSETFTGSSAIKGAFPVENEAWASKLTESDVSSATLQESNGQYLITITTVADGKSANVTHGQGHAPKAFNVVLPGVVNDNIPSVAASMVGTATIDYPASTAKIIVDAATGHVISAQYDLYWTINFDKAGAILPFHTSDSYTVKY